MTKYFNTGNKAKSMIYRQEVVFWKASILYRKVLNAKTLTLLWATCFILDHSWESKNLLFASFFLPACYTLISKLFQHVHKSATMASHLLGCLLTFFWQQHWSFQLVFHVIISKALYIVLWFFTKKNHYAYLSDN